MLARSANLYRAAHSAKLWNCIGAIGGARTAVPVPLALYQLRLQSSNSAKDAPTDAKPPANAVAETKRTLVLPQYYADVVRRLLRRFLPRYQSEAIGKVVYTACSTYPEYKEFWVDDCQMPETFQTWFSTTSLYVWMAMVRIRADPNAKHYNQGLVDCFFRDTEQKMRSSGIKSSRIVNDTLKDLVSSFKGTVMSLDEGFARSDAVLAAAIWRNLVPVDENVIQIDLIARYVRQEIQRLDRCAIEDLTAGKFAFRPVTIF
ncbi:Ubiquinol cytochrome-c reductase assembly protein Cbp3 [Coemansia aciculifera]|uniref:Ubiquinol cytochrome-c reductase assembly protein Cbp3 n=1 Tax=Coemansia aciculifera TaxID=417176 RepID=A0ACC1LT52_9FUNG|nr:Ubiquinol cytochrome-c reductase assembly protein Cbp3 [Coemansia aciculifera]